MPMSDRERFLEAVRQATADTPYTVTPTESGFDVGLDIVDTKWFGLINKSGLSMAYIHHVKVGEGRYSITDDARSLEWVAGVPRLAATGSRQLGRVKEFGFRKTWAFDEQGRLGKVVDYRFDSEEGRSLVTEAGKQLGLRQVRSTTEKIGIGFALVGAVGAVVTVVVLLIGALLGAF
jgi:hypothetical protein